MFFKKLEKKKERKEYRVGGRRVGRREEGIVVAGGSMGRWVGGRRAG